MILRGFIGPYIVSFFIVEFVLVMQFMWKYIDDLLGRGFSMFDYLELLGLFSIQIMPEALPLTVLLSSVMVYGDLAEHFELSSLKSAGLSLVRIFMPAIVVAICTATLSLAASNYFKPQASKAFWQKFNDMKLSKVTFSFEEKIFNTDFKDRAIYIDKVHSDGQSLDKVLIYYIHPNLKYLMDVTTAESAKMQVSADGKYLIMDLVNGQNYQERIPPGTERFNYLVEPKRNLPINMTTFKKYRIVFHLKDIFRDMSDINLERKKFDMMNAFEILNQVDSLDHQVHLKEQENFYEYADIVEDAIRTEKVEKENEPQEKKEDPKELAAQQYQRKMARMSTRARVQMGGVGADVMSRLINALQIEGSTQSPFHEVIPDDVRQKVIDSAKGKNSTLSTRTYNSYIQNRSLKRNKQRYLLRMHQQFCFALVCILLLFIGGPMGAIVKKGGFGYPMLVAIGFYTSFLILKILGERLVYSSSLTGAMGGWLPFLVLLPFAITVTLMALKDIPFSPKSVFNYFKRSRAAKN